MRRYLNATVPVLSAGASKSGCRFEPIFALSLGTAKNLYGDPYAGIINVTGATFTQPIAFNNKGRIGPHLHPRRRYHYNLHKTIGDSTGLSHSRFGRTDGGKARLKLSFER
jgi:hypothetical protein